MATRTAEQEEHWQEVRRIVLRRDEYICRDCGVPSDRRELDVHHLVPRYSGGRDEPSNCVTLCDGCHAGRHPNLQVSLSRRMIQRWALRLARTFDRDGEMPEDAVALDAGLRLFGIDRFRDGQLEAVLTALRGESMLVIRPTGGGKSLCYQLPAVLAGQPTTLVLSPLKALMVDQVAAIHEKRIPATFINSDITGDEKEQRYELLEQGALSLFYAAPERFNSQRVRADEVEWLLRQRPRYLVVDEAHLVDRWGADFRPDYSRIAALRERLGNPPVLAFTATAGYETQERIKRSLGVPEARTLISGADRPNITLARVPLADEHAKAKTVIGLIRNLPAGRAMIFVPTTNVGREVRDLFEREGFPLPLYHGKLERNERDVLLGRFSGRLDPPLQAVICTSAFSLGLDIPDVRLVVNWQHPASVEDYLQEFGRAGRDGKPAQAVLFTAGGKEAGLLRWMADRTAEEAVEKRVRTFEEAQETRRGRYQRIEQMGELSRQKERCFREALNEVLIGPQSRRRRTLTQRILDWAFSRRDKVQKAVECCDKCDPQVVRDILAHAPSDAGGRARSRRR